MRRTGADAAATRIRQLRKYRAVCTVEMLRTTWEKTSNPYLRIFTAGDRPKIRIKRRVLLPRDRKSVV